MFVSLRIVDNKGISGPEIMSILVLMLKKLVLDPYISGSKLKNDIVIYV